jgi:hypothetical protein
MTAMSEARRARAQRARVAHPLHERLIPNLDGAPPAILEAHERAERVVKARIDHGAKRREAEAAAQAAPANDDHAAKTAIAEGKPTPKRTVPAAEAKLTEARRTYALAVEAEQEALDHLARTIATHAHEWVSLTENLDERAKATAGKLEAALNDWHELDAAFTLAAWLHHYDPNDVHTLSQGNVRGLRAEDFDPETALRRMLALTERADVLAQEGESGRERFSRAQAKRAEFRRQVQAGQAA